MRNAPSPQSASSLSESLEDYLEAILHIEEEKEVVRPKDIAAYLNVSPPSVTAAVQNLGIRGLANYRPYDRVTLTPAGRQVAEDIAGRHKALYRFFADILCIDSEEADQIACSMEHSLPPHVLARLVTLTDTILSSPHGPPVITEDQVLRLGTIENPLLRSAD